MPPKFPGPYVETTNADDPIMKRVPFDTTGIGARKSGQPKSVASENMGLDHVGGAASGRGK